MLMTGRSTLAAELQQRGQAHHLPILCRYFGDHADWPQACKVEEAGFCGARVLPDAAPFDRAQRHDMARTDEIFRDRTRAGRGL